MMLTKSVATACYSQSIMNTSCMSMKDVEDKIHAGIDKKLQKLMKTSRVKFDKAFVGRTKR